MGMERAGVTFASLMSLGPDAAARTPRAGRPSSATRRTGRPRRPGRRRSPLLAAVGAAAPSLDLGTGVLALQLRTPMLVAMAGATLQALHPDRDILLGIGISSPVVTSRWHGVPYGDRPARPGARVRHPAARLPLRREGRLRRRLLRGEALPARRAARRAATQDRHRRAQPEDAAPGRRAGRRRAAQLPARRRTCRGRSSRCARAATPRSTPTSTSASASARRASSSPAATSSPTPSSTPTPATSSGPASPTRSPRSGPATPRATARARWPRCPTAWSTPST